MFSVINIIVFGIGGFFLISWMLFYIKGLKSAALFTALTEKEYPLKEIYFVGHAVMELIHYPFKSKYDRKLRKELAVLYTPKYADFYIRVIYAQKVTIALSIIVLSFIMYGLSNDIMILAVVIVLAGVAYYYFGTLTEKRILKRSEEMLSDFAEVISKIALLTNAGMILRECWEEVAYTGDTSLYLEMQKTVDEMNNGIAEVDAFFNFGSRCIIPEIKKFTSTLVQGLVKGNSELAAMLKEQSKEIWAAKKQEARRQGEKAASKLLIPMMIMFVGILILVIVPIFSNF